MNLWFVDINNIGGSSLKVNKHGSYIIDKILSLSFSLPFLTIVHKCKWGFRQNLSTFLVTAEGLILKLEINSSTNFRSKKWAN